METGSIAKKLAKREANHLFLWAGALVFLAIATFLVVQSLTSTTLSAGPRIRIDEIPNDGSKLELTPGVLDNDGLRVAWAAATATIFLGISFALFSLGQVAKRVLVTPFFSKEIQTSIRAQAFGTFILLAIGGFGRSALADNIRDELDIVGTVSESAEKSNVLFSWMLEIPFFALYLVAALVGWVFTQGAAVQAETEDIV